MFYLMFAKRKSNIRGIEDWMQDSDGKTEGKGCKGEGFGINNVFYIL